MTIKQNDYFDDLDVTKSENKGLTDERKFIQWIKFIRNTQKLYMLFLC